MLPFSSWLGYILAITGFVGFWSGAALAFLWALRSSLGLEWPRQPERLWHRRAGIGLKLILGGLLLGTAIELAVGIGPVILLLFLVQGVFGDEPPALIAVLSLVLVIGFALLIGAWFARHWQRVVSRRLESLAA